MNMPSFSLRRLSICLLSLALLTLLVALFLPAGAGPGQATGTVLGKEHLSALLGSDVAQLSQGLPFEIKSARLGPMTLTPSINPELQERAQELLKRYKSLRGALVVLEADTGRVLVLAGRRGRHDDPGVALEAAAPAASLFKIITAAAAVEEINLRPSSLVSFVGRPHSLFRYQLAEKTRRKPHRVTLAKSFADSNNPAFARLGAHRLGGELLVWYARALGFDRRLPFELPVGVSRMERPRGDFEVGSLACGYTRTTIMSPLHAALLVSVFLNHGRFMQPYAIDQVVGAGGEVLYLGAPQGSARLVSEGTCRSMRQLFEATVLSGTARQAFKRLNRDKVLRGLELGGKTGTLRGEDRKELFEWFAGYGLDPRTGRALAVAALTVHGQVRTANPRFIARTMLRELFRPTHAANQVRPTHMVRNKGQGAPL